jgi:hypothetical protein
VSDGSERTATTLCRFESDTRRYGGWATTRVRGRQAHPTSCPPWLAQDDPREHLVRSVRVLEERGDVVVGENRPRSMFKLNNQGLSDSRKKQESAESSRLCVTSVSSTRDGSTPRRARGAAVSVGGVNLHAAVRLDKADRRGLQALLRHAARPACPWRGSASNMTTCTCTHATASARSPSLRRSSCFASPLSRCRQGSRYSATWARSRPTAPGVEASSAPCHQGPSRRHPERVGAGCLGRVSWRGSSTSTPPDVRNVVPPCVGSPTRWTQAEHGRHCGGLGRSHGVRRRSRARDRRRRRAARDKVCGREGTGARRETVDAPREPGMDAMTGRRRSVLHDERQGVSRAGGLASDLLASRIQPTARAPSSRIRGVFGSSAGRTTR